MPAPIKRRINMAKNEAQEVDTVEDGDAPLIDLNEASIKKVLQRFQVLR